MDAATMIELHSCSYFCERPACIKTQRDEMRDNGNRRSSVGGSIARDEEMKTKMTLQELRNMIGITFAKRMERASQEEIEKELLACINEWLRGDDEPTRLKREKK